MCTVECIKQKDGNVPAGPSACIGSCWRSTTARKSTSLVARHISGALKSSQPQQRRAPVVVAPAPGHRDRRAGKEVRQTVLRVDADDTDSEAKKRHGNFRAMRRA